MVMSQDERGVASIISASATLHLFIFFEISNKPGCGVDLEVGPSHLWLMGSGDMVQQMSLLEGLER